jgi:hypothetical protein
MTQAMEQDGCGIRPRRPQPLRLDISRCEMRAGEEDFGEAMDSRLGRLVGIEPTTS